MNRVLQVLRHTDVEIWKMQDNSAVLCRNLALHFGTKLSLFYKAHSYVYNRKQKWNCCFQFPSLVQLYCWIVELPLYYLCLWKTLSCQHLEPNKIQTNNNNNMTKPISVKQGFHCEELLPFPRLHPVNIWACGSQGAVRCQICSRRAYSKMHVQPLCQEVDVPVMTKSSLRQQVYLT